MNQHELVILASRPRCSGYLNCCFAATGSVRDFSLTRAVQGLRLSCTHSPGAAAWRYPWERVARLSGGVATIKAGAATEVEMREKKAASRTRCTQSATTPLRRPAEMPALFV